MNEARQGPGPQGSGPEPATFPNIAHQGESDMKITKILFLGIVLVMFNIAYLAAQDLPDSVTVTMTSADPGSVMEITVDVRFQSDNAGGLVLVLAGFPTNLVSTDVGVDLADGTAPTEDGTWYYEWTDGYGKPLKAAGGLAADVLMSPGDPTGEDSSATLGITLLGANIDQLKILPVEFGGFDPATVGPMLKVWVNVPEDLPEGTYPVQIPESGAVIGTFSPPGTFDGVPYTSVSELVVANIPDNTFLEMVAAQGVTSGGTAEIGVKLANKDSVGSGSFAITFDDAVMTLDSVVAGSRATGATFGFSAPQAAGGTQLAADVATTVTFSGLNAAPGGLGDLCKLYFDVAEVGAGATASVALSSVDLNDPSGADVIDQIAPSVPATALTFSFGDTLSLADMMGERTATIIEGKLYVPVMLTNASAVSAVEFVILEPAGNDSILSLSSEQVANMVRADGWMISAVDSIRGVRVIAYPAVAGNSIAAGSGKLFDVVFDINTNAFTVPAAGDPTVDLILGLSQVSITSATGSMLGVEAMGATASLDYRVPNEGEGTGPGATLPRAFSLQQNHPNPFNPSTTINYQIPDDVGSVRFALNVYDLRGRMVRTLDNGMKGAGTYSVFWDGTDNNGRQVSSGVYFYRFVSSEYNATRKMIMLK